MKRLTLLIFFFIGICGAFAQNISVKSFKSLPMDMTASSLEGKRIDQNGQVAALIKVVTTETNFTFEGGTLGIVHTKQTPGEVWVWVPRAARKITIKHPKLGVLRDYYYPVEIEAERTYEMVLTTAKIETVIKEEVRQQYLAFKVSPPNATLEVNEEIWEVDADGNAQDYVSFGTYSWRVQAPNYHPDAGNIVVNDPDNTQFVNVTLEPNFGWIEVAGTGNLQGASVYIDNALIGKAPCKSEALKSGQHTVRIVKKMYATHSETVTVKDNETIRLIPILDADFAEVTLKVDADAEIWVNNEKKGTRTWTGPLGSGTYKMECKLANHETSMTTKEITVAMNGQTITLPAPTPIYGSLNVESTPKFCKLYIDGKEMGTTPKSINEILIGQHEIRLTQDGYADHIETMTIAKGERKMLQIELSRRYVSIMVVPSDIWCNRNGYKSVSNNNGVKDFEPDYKKALQNDSDLVKAIDKLSTLMADRGFPIENLSDAIKNGENNHVLKPDVWIDLNYTIKRIGPRYFIEFDLWALDSHSRKVLASVMCRSKETVTIDIAAMLEEAMMDRMDGFCESLLTYSKSLKDK